jgi:hypothetical protein
LWTDVARDFGEGRASGSTIANWRLAEGGDISLWNVEADLFFKAGDRLAWGPGYKFQQARAPGASFEDEHRYLLTGRWRFVASAWMWELRGLYEYRNFDSAPDAWRVRVRPGASRALGGSVWAFFVQNEMFYDSRLDRYSQNRIRLGLQRPLVRGAALAFYYMMRSDRRDGDWDETHVVGTIWRLP